VCVQLDTGLLEEGAGDGVVDQSGGSNQTAAVKRITPRILSDALATLASVTTTDAVEAETVAMDTFLDSHHPCIGRCRLIRMDS